MKPKVKFSVALLYLSPVIIFYSFIFVLPLILVFLQSFGLYSLGPMKPPKFTLEYYLKFFDLKGPYLESLWFSFWNSALATVIISVISFFLAIFFYFVNFKGKSFVSATYKIPLFIPYLISAFAWWNLLSPGGYAQRLLAATGIVNPNMLLVNDPNGIGIIVANVWMNFPYMVLLITGTLKMIDPTLIEAARTLGSTFWKSIFKIVLPLSMPGFLAGSILSFIGMFGAFSVAFILGASWPQYMSISIYNDVTQFSEYGMASVQSVIYMISAILITYFYTKIIARLQGERR
ncbi:ABC transporter permease [Athalassotoga saccharophila]|uniref:ABC transporter permease n=1 Tax=Athalassotoga saccharophila TaxID=1441386 RepID=UPI00137B05A8|nr:ABC transporter permease [Athalassotoga saccharophila]BBJ27531.1 spermidine/putrescine transport system permease protein PotB [Athalassotoga saccharophila]